MPGINFTNEELPEEVQNLILDKQTELTKKKKVKVSKQQTVVILLKEAYLKNVKQS